MLLLADILRQYRRQHALFQKEIAASLGISREHYAQIEGGNVSPSLKLLQRISEKLELNIVVVLDRGKCQFQRVGSSTAHRVRTSHHKGR